MERRFGRSGTSVAGTVLVAALLIVLAGWFAPSAHAAPTWASPDTATIRPGGELVTEGAQCTANFVFSDGDTVFIGQAAHCSGKGEGDDTNGCETDSHPLGTKVEVAGATKPGTLVYSSWIAMHDAKETDPSACAFNDLGLVRLDPADAGRVNPTVPVLGGPSGIATSTASGDQVRSYQNSSLRQGIDLLKPKTGISLGTSDGGWNHTVYTVTPGIPGDSGSGFLTADGRAFGVLSTVAIAPLALSNGVSDLSRMLAYVRAHTSLRPVLALASLGGTATGAGTGSSGDGTGSGGSGSGGGASTKGATALARSWSAQRRIGAFTLGEALPPASAGPVYASRRSAGGTTRFGARSRRGAPRLSGIATTGRGITFLLTTARGITNRGVGVGTTRAVAQRRLRGLRFSASGRCGPRLTRSGRSARTTLLLRAGRVRAIQIERAAGAPRACGTLPR